MSDLALRFVELSLTGEPARRIAQSVCLFRLSVEVRLVVPVDLQSLFELLQRVVKKVLDITGDVFVLDIVLGGTVIATDTSHCCVPGEKGNASSFIKLNFFQPQQSWCLVDGCQWCKFGLALTKTQT